MFQDEKRQEEEDAKKLNDRMTKGAILCLKNIATGTTREQIKEAFDMYSPIAYIEFNMGDTEAALRFETEGSASVALDKAKDANEGKISINGGEVEYNVLEGDEEVEHWKKIFQDQKERRDFKRKGNFGGRGRKRFGGGGRYDSQKRQQNNEKDNDNKQAANEGEPAAKKQKTEIEATS
ncbi:hypothetical protein LSAT2_021162 [Lamellibrachia satsuma]|nr:hypothetical protein LSAT2_021162 [Lamellibrachia satsuma]